MGNYGGEIGIVMEIMAGRWGLWWGVGDYGGEVVIMVGRCDYYIQKV